MKVCYLCVFERWRGVESSVCVTVVVMAPCWNMGARSVLTHTDLSAEQNVDLQPGKKRRKQMKKQKTKKTTGFNHSVCWTSPAAPQTSAEDTTAHKYSIYGYLARTFSLLHNTETTYTHKTTYVYLSWWLHSPLWRAGWPPITIRWRFTRLIINSPVLKQHREVTGGRWGGETGIQDSPAGVTELGNVVCLLFSFFVCF